MAARAIWKGRIQLDKLRVPVKLYSAVQDRATHFHILEKRTHSPIKQHMVDPDTGEEVPRERIRMGYEVTPGSFVTVTKDELASIEPEASRDIEITRFVPPEKIDHRWYERPYYLGPDGNNDAYFALAQALEKKKREAVARWVMRKKHYLGALRVENGYLTLITLRDADEVLSARELQSPAGREPDARELKMAQQLVAALEDEFRPDDSKTSTVSASRN